MRKLLIAVVLVVTACASSSSGDAVKADAKAAAAAPEKMSITNLLNFDVGTCSLNPVEGSLNETLVMAALLGARPSFGECLIDPKSRGQEAETQVTVKANLNEGEAKFDVAGTNLMPEGKACIEKTLGALGFKPLSKGQKAIEVSVPYVFQGTQGVRWGVNEPSDVAGQIRIAQASWCNCFATVGAKAPPNLKAALQLQPGQPLAITIDAKEPDQALAACLEPKLKAMTPKVTRQLTMTYPFLLTNSGSGTENEAADPATQFQQLAVIGTAGEVQVARDVGAVELAALEYSQAGQRYNAKPSGPAMKDVRERCAALVSKDEELKNSLEALKATYERTKQVISGLKATDAAWAQIEPGVIGRLTQTEKQIGPAAEQKKAHSAACQKLK